jgi:hypothetical protein
MCRGFTKKKMLEFYHGKLTGKQSSVSRRDSARDSVVSLGNLNQLATQRMGGRPFRSNTGEENRSGSDFDDNASFGSSVDLDFWRSRVGSLRSFRDGTNGVIYEQVAGGRDEPMRR